MNKQDWIWISIRIFGIYLIVLSITCLPELLGSISKKMIIGGDYYLPSAQSSKGLNACAEYANQMRVKSTVSIIVSFLKVTIYGAVGLYFIRGGNFLFKIISSTGNSNKE